MIKYFEDHELIKQEKTEDFEYFEYISSNGIQSALEIYPDGFTHVYLGGGNYTGWVAGDTPEKAVENWLKYNQMIAGISDEATILKIERFLNFPELRKKSADVEVIAS